MRRPTLWSWVAVNALVLPAVHAFFSAPLRSLSPPPCRASSSSPSSRLQAAATVSPTQASPSTASQNSGGNAAKQQQTGRVEPSPSPPAGDGIGGARPIRLSLSERARTVTYVATAATLGTFSETASTPFGSYVDYILDDKGWPVLLLSEQSLHTQNIRVNPQVSLFVQMPRSGKADAASAALSRVTLIGSIVPVEAEELPAIRTAYSIVHSYSERLVESPKFSFCKLKPERVYFVGGFGVQSKWLEVSDYEAAVPDVLAHEMARIVARINQEHEPELRLMCRHFLGARDVDQVTATTVDRLGIDLRVTTGELTDEYRVGFREKVVSTEDAKSELVKMFQEAWEREHDYAWTDELPPVIRYAEDILRKKG
ncbi:hypothetical protein NSK_001504 [Nannochloropsis salina CCMP1776]|uniref:Uncharacterized protein n=1 Tax=Nannochloropsis salina CCMP1776 TaxID=1027361 RepID=A0A4D9D6I7_9STRA|nr:hypothetical protein NSK_001504 [Nannochloropsis salina CCMP1776]|eukprot:TFJ87172.1 hypothetical protein NSK_001504 [Nannochloropsis salina CCMP1776]